MNYLIVFLLYTHIANITLLFVSSANSSVTTTDSSDDVVSEDFFQSNMFMGLAIGGGSFLVLVTCLCIVWRCTCGRGGDDDDDKNKSQKRDNQKNRLKSNVGENRSRRNGRVTPVIVV